MPVLQPRHRRFLVAALASAAALAVSPPLGAQTVAGTADAPRVIAYLGIDPSESVRVCMNQMRVALQEAGWSFDDQLVLEWNDAGGNPARLAPMARALVARRPAVLVSTENMPTEALKQATQTLPIVVMGSTNLHDVLDAQLRPTANVTGVSLGLNPVG